MLSRIKLIKNDLLYAQVISGLPGVTEHNCGVLAFGICEFSQEAMTAKQNLEYKQYLNTISKQYKYKNNIFIYIYISVNRFKVCKMLNIYLTQKGSYCNH